MVTTSDTVSIVIPMRDEATSLPECLPAAVAASRVLSDHTRLEMLLLVGPSEDDTWSLAQRFLSEIRGFAPTSACLHAPPSKARAIELGVATASGSWIILTDADVMPEPGAYAALLSRACSEGAHVCAGRPRAMIRESQPWLSRSWAQMSSEAWHTVRSERADLRWAISGQLFLIARSVFPSSESVEPLLDDGYIGWRAWQQGALFSYEPSAVVYFLPAGTAYSLIMQKLRVRRGWERLRLAGARQEVDRLRVALAGAARSQTTGRDRIRNRVLILFDTSLRIAGKLTVASSAWHSAPGSKQW